MPATPDGPTQAAGAVAHVAQPASPTLTNPDMILPDYYDDSASSPERSQSPVAIWQGTHDLSFQLPPQAFSAGPISPTTPIIYGNGTMLSDIGEVTEVESVCGKPEYRPYTQQKNAPAVGATALSQHLGRKKETRAARQRRASMDSNSTITGGDEKQMHFNDFDDSVSVGGSSFQGDDEESVAESYNDEPRGHQRALLLQESSNMDERYSTALSRRAEQILANAKRRLTTMEGNLHRARSSLSSPTLSSVDSDRTPSPKFNRAVTREPAIKPAGRNPYGHNRVSSEHAVPTGPKLSTQLPRSSSALGAAGGYRKPLHIHIASAFDEDTNEDDESEYSTEGKDEHIHYKNPVYGNTGFSKSKPALETLTEHSVSPTGGAMRDSQSHDDLNSQLRPDSALSPHDQTIRRSASASQMRDLKEQMTDLKGRLSSLRDQARADSLKRRSMQSLRTPSPFTHAPVEQWYSSQRSSTQSSEVLPMQQGPAPDASAQQDTEKVTEANGVSVPESEPDNETADDSMLGFVDVVDEDDEVIPYRAPSLVDDEYTDDLRTEDGFEDYRDEFVDFRSDSEASMYHDSVQHQLSHEDREDAFDYEHFFLHSAMGSMTRRRMERRNSDTTYTSEESVETTRGPDIPIYEKGHVRHRRGSHGSSSTVASFATATEGRSTRLDENITSNAAEQLFDSMERTRTSSEQAKRATFGGAYGDSGSDQSSRPPSSMHNPKPKSAHRPSVSSIGSSGTTRSFPLVNKPKSNGVLTPRDSPEQGHHPVNDVTRSETSSLYDLDSMAGDNTAAAMTALSKDDQILVQRLVASLGKCVLGLTESGRASTESRIARKRIEHAKRILEGLSD
ncbi:uncharacterized protein B0I36DRAFT_309099 [Microdochium trichocladiopsis]|uniref:Uncharacterized protein n=1 Tax=Microdochium trichocladiopsis TaxID=1682393 RepID=A0A9P9BZ34_9PEZI|nr:uncharacterized protein B0I36DRAFT_309099 [Microdochium trichocladiopsis]KAH7039689.1 hypothetical protein B0I36DRAFT_309099 [Microdochium trichocladiopsis]